MPCCCVRPDPGADEAHDRRRGHGRIGPHAARSRTARGSFSDPAFMPVGTRGSIRALSTHELSAIRAADGSAAEIMLGNTYHLMLRPGAETVAALGGLHRFTGWDGLHLTDSGGYQVFSLEPEVDDEGARFRSTYDGSHPPAHPGGRGRHPGAARCRHPDGARRVRPAAVGPPRSCATRSTARRCGPVGRGGPTDAATTRPCSASCREGPRPTCAPSRRSEPSALDFDGYAIGGLSVGETPGRRCSRRSRPRSPCLPPTSPAT